MLELRKGEVVQGETMETLIISHFMLLRHFKGANRHNLTLHFDSPHQMTESVKFSEVLGDDDYLFLFRIIIFFLLFWFLGFLVFFPLDID